MWESLHIVWNCELMMQHKMMQLCVKCKIIKTLKLKNSDEHFSGRLFTFTEIQYNVKCSADNNTLIQTSCGPIIIKTTLYRSKNRNRFLIVHWINLIFLYHARANERFNSSDLQWLGLT